MESIGVLEARMHFGKLLDRVERGERVAVTREGRHVATIIPAHMQPGEATLAVERILDRRERIRREGGGLSISSILAARDEGRKGVS